MKKQIKQGINKISGKTSSNQAVGKMIGFGIIAGMRATFAPLFLSDYFNEHSNSAISNSKLRFVQSPVAASVTKALGLLEIIGDKSPSSPNRTVAPQVLARVASGAFAGATIAKAHDQALVKGILIGGLSALAATYGVFYLRKYIDTLPKVKDLYVGAAEDAVALVSGALLMKKSL